MDTEQQEDQVDINAMNENKQEEVENDPQSQPINTEEDQEIPNITDTEPSQQPDNKMEVNEENDMAQVDNDNILTENKSNSSQDGNTNNEAVLSRTASQSNKDLPIDTDIATDNKPQDPNNILSSVESVSAQEVKKADKNMSQISLLKKDINKIDEDKPVEEKNLTEFASEYNIERLHNGPIYCIEQVRIPPELPDILKDFAKHIIRAQPNDIIAESLEYFKRLNKIRNAQDIIPEDELNDVNTNNDNSSFHDGEKNDPMNIDDEEVNKKVERHSELELESLYEKLNDFAKGNVEMPVDDLKRICQESDISSSQIDEALVIGSWEELVDWLKFWALIVAGSNDSLLSTLQIIMKIIGDETTVPVKSMKTIIEFLLNSDPNIDSDNVAKIFATLDER